MRLPARRPGTLADGVKRCSASTGGRATLSHRAGLAASRGRRGGSRLPVEEARGAAEDEREREARRHRADPPVRRARALDEFDPPCRPAGSAIGRRRSRRSRRRRAPAEMRARREDVALPVMAAREQPVREQDGEERDEERPQQREERQVRPRVDDRGRRSSRRPRPRDEDALRHVGHRVLSETAVEYMLAKASSVSSKSTARSASALARPAAATAAGSAPASLIPLPRTISTLRARTSTSR